MLRSAGMLARVAAAREGSRFGSDFSRQSVLNTVNEYGFDGNVRTSPSTRPGAILSDLIFAGIHQSRLSSAAAPHTQEQAVDVARTRGFTAGAAFGADAQSAVISRTLQRLISEGTVDARGAGEVQRQEARVGSASFPGSPERLAAAQRDIDESDARLAASRAEYARLRAIADESIESISARTANRT